MHAFLDRNTLAAELFGGENCGSASTERVADSLPVFTKADQPDEDIDRLLGWADSRLGRGASDACGAAFSLLPIVVRLAADQDELAATGLEPTESRPATVLDPRNHAVEIPASDLQRVDHTVTVAVVD